MFPTAAGRAPAKPLDPVSLLAVAARSTCISSTLALHEWLEGEMRSFIPHDVLLVARRDVSNGQLTCEVVGATRGLQQGSASTLLSQSVEGVFDRWLAADRVPITVSTIGLDHAGKSHNCQTILAHGLADERANAQYLYMFLGQADLDEPNAREASAVLLPFIDCGCRKLLGHQGEAAPAAKGRLRSDSTRNRPLTGSNLSQREVEIMRWVCEGKKNFEIGDLLGLSKATVKNHMRRIYQKMDVMNRAQAVETFERQQAPAAAALTH